MNYYDVVGDSLFMPPGGHSRGAAPAGGACSGPLQCKVYCNFGFVLSTVISGCVVYCNFGLCCLLFIWS